MGYESILTYANEVGSISVYKKRFETSQKHLAEIFVIEYVDAISIDLVARMTNEFESYLQEQSSKVIRYSVIDAKRAKLMGTISLPIAAAVRSLNERVAPYFAELQLYIVNDFIATLAKPFMGLLTHLRAVESLSKAEVLVRADAEQQELV